MHPGPQSRSDRASSEDLATRRFVAEGNALPIRGKNNLVLARDIATTQSRKTDIANFPRTGMPIAHHLFYISKIDTPSLGQRFTQRQCSAGRRIDLVPVVHLEHFNVIVDPQHPRRLLGQGRQQGHTYASISRANHRHIPCSLDNFFFLIGREPGCTRHNRDPSLRS